MIHFFVQRIGFWLFAVLAMSLMAFPVMRAEQVAVRHREGTIHGFLVLRDEEGKTLAAGDLIQTSTEDRIVSNLVFHFKDGSVDDDTTVFTQHDSFRLISDHHVQKGPSFPRQIDVLIDASSGMVTVENGREKAKTDHLALKPDLANGLLLTLLKNVQPGAPETKVSYVAATPKPRLVTLSIKPQGEEEFRIATVRRKATNYDVKIELSGVAGVIAPLIGKQPKDIHIWILGGKAPAFVRMKGQLYPGGPLWTIELTSPVWQETERSSH